MLTPLATDKPPSQKQEQRLAGGFTSCPINKTVCFSKVPSTGVVAKCHNILSATHKILMVILGFLQLSSALMLLWLPLLAEFRQGVILWQSCTPSSFHVSISVSVTTHYHAGRDFSHWQCTQFISPCHYPGLRNSIRVNWSLHQLLLLGVFTWLVMIANPSIFDFLILSYF